jgi:Ca-activated chloride channel family protein
MTITVTAFDEPASDDPSGIGCLMTERGNLPLHKLDVRAAVTGLNARTDVVQGFHNPYDTPLEATYVFPLPDRAAVVAMTLTADGRTIVAELQERSQARETYDRAIAEGKRASIAEEDRPDVFTMRVGNIAPGEHVEVALVLVTALPFEDGEAAFRFPLVVAPRYIPGRPLAGGQAGDGYAPDTESTPDASRITPPVLLPGFPNPIDLSIEVAIDPAGLPLGAVRSSLHTIVRENNTIRLEPGERVNRDFILRLPYGDAASQSTTLTVVADGDGAEGTFELTVVPPPPAAGSRPKDVVLLLDRSGSMQGWKMVAARRSAARIVDTLVAADRFAVLTFDNVVEQPDGLPAGLVAATDRNRYRAVEHLSRADARGGTDLLEPLNEGLIFLAADDASRDRVLVLITDGQVGNEDQILASVAGLMHGVRVHTVGIDQAVNAGFLGRLAGIGGGRCELVESEDRLDAAMDAIHRRIARPLVAHVELAGTGLIDGTLTPARLPGLFSGVPLVVRGRYRGAPPALTLTGTTGDGIGWEAAASPVPAADRTSRQLWARSALRDLEDTYAAEGSSELEQRIVATSLRFGVLCRFTAFVAVDSRIVNEGGVHHRVIQPVELPRGWDASTYHLASAAMAPMAAMAAAPTAARGAALQRGKRSSFAVREVSDTGDNEPTDLELAAARSQVVEEAKRLDEPIDSEADRRDALDDLASRLEALARHLDSVGIDPAALRAVVRLLRDETLSTTDRWEHARQALREFAYGEATARPFWKRY